MASQQSTVDFIVEQIGGAGRVSARKMFGEYGIYCDGKMVALVCDDQLYIKPTAAGRAYIGDVTEGAPYPSAKPWFPDPGRSVGSKRLADRVDPTIHGSAAHALEKRMAK